MGRNALKSWTEQNRHNKYVIKDMVKNIKFRCEMNKTPDNLAAIHLTNIILDIL